MRQFLQNQKGLVQKVFNNVHDKYDIMNDLMSLGIHRIWKKDFIMMMSPAINKKLIDVGCGTGDIGDIFLKAVKSKGKVFNIDPNKKMIAQGKKRFGVNKNVNWKIGSGEKLPYKKNSFDYYTISFGMRNTKNINTTLKEAYRVLKPGGRFLCLEFSKIQNQNLETIYKKYSEILPFIGELIVGKKQPYEYLIESIEKFINQEQLIYLMEKNNFKNCKYRNLSGGIVAIHSGWKI